jgi:thiol-disulfide isomerase/thioredoxin
MRWWALLLALLAAPASSDEPAFTFLDASGQPVEIRPEPNSGRALVLHFWATWCPECAEDLAHLAEASAGCDRVRAIAVNAGDSAEQVQSYLSRHAIRLTVLRDPGGSAWRTLDGRGLPMNAYWSARGHETDLGPKTREQWKDRFAQLGCTFTPSGAHHPT